MKYLLAASSANVAMQTMLLVIHAKAGESFSAGLNFVCMIAWAIVMIICLKTMED